MPTDPITDTLPSDTLETFRQNANANADRRLWQNISEQTTDYTVADGVDTVLVDVSASTTVTVTLPDSASSYSGRMILVVAKSVGASGQLDVDVAGGSDTVNGTTSVSKTAVGHWWFMADGTSNWMILTSA